MSNSKQVHLIVKLINVLKINFKNKLNAVAKTNSFEKEQNRKFDLNEMDKFYTMLCKMKKKRPQLNIEWIMESLYKNEYIHYKEQLKN